MQIVSINAEVRLYQEVQALKMAMGIHYALHFNISRLQPHHRSEYQVKIALNILNDVFRNARGTIFALRDGDLAVLCHGKNNALMEKAIFQLRYLYADDPLANDGDGAENPDFCGVYDLNRQWRSYYRLCMLRAEYALPTEDGYEPEVSTENFGNTVPIDTAPAQPPLAELIRAVPVPSAPAAVEDDGLGFTPAKLAALQQKLQTVDMVPILRKQPVCAVRHTADAKIMPVFCEMYANIRHLEEALRVPFSLLSNRHLFRYVTEQLDARMLDLLTSAPETYVDTPISLNLNVKTVLSEQFQHFAARLQETVKVKLVVEFAIGDVFDDMKAFMAAREILRSYNYRLCLDGLTTDSFIYVDREQLQFDLVKLQWNADVVGDLRNSHNVQLRDAIARCGQNRLILCRCDDRRAIEFGQGLGISLFQGRHTDKVINPEALVVN